MSWSSQTSSEDFVLFSIKLLPLFPMDLIRPKPPWLDNINIYTTWDTKRMKG